MGDSMENTKTIIIDSGNLINNVIQFPNREKSEEKEAFIYVEFTYKHLLPKLEAA